MPIHVVKKESGLAARLEAQRHSQEWKRKAGGLNARNNREGKTST